MMEERIKETREEKDMKAELRRQAEDEILTQLTMENKGLFTGYDLESRLRGVLESLTEEERAEVF